MLQYAIVPVPCGSVCLIASAHGLTHLILTPRRGSRACALVRERVADAEHEPGLLPDFQQQIRDYFAGEPVRFNVATDLSSLTPFQRQVLRACAKIGHGQTRTYGQLARSIGRPTAARAVGAALARNPVPLVIPCHRVVAGDGSLGGFSAEQGVSLKRELLGLEGRGTTPHAVR